MDGTATRGAQRRDEIARELAEFRMRTQSEDNTSKTREFGIGELGHTPASTVEDEIEAERIQPTVQRDLVKCACGHMCARRLVMSTSRGSSCSDCYDRMSN